MVRVGVKEARSNLSQLLDRVRSGEEVVLLSRGKEIARLMPARQRRRRLPAMAHFRSSVRVRGTPLSEEIAKARKERS